MQPLMFDQELREGAQRNEGESFKKFLGRRVLVAVIALIGVSVVAFAMLTVIASQ